MLLEPDNQWVALVTGSTGFVGRHLTRKLVREGWCVHVVTRPDSILPDDLEFLQVVRHVHDGGTDDMMHCIARAKPHVVFHLAALTLSRHSPADVDRLIKSNVLFGNQLLEAMVANDVSYLINTGTFWQHYNNEDYNPSCLYAATKQAFESIIEYYVQACEIKVISLELFDTYGPADSRAKLFSLLDKAASTGEVLSMSAGEQLIDLVHIEDVVDAYLVAAERLLQGKVSKHEVYSVSSGHQFPLKELVRLYAVVTEKIIPINWGGKPYRPREVMIPWNKGVAIDGWIPRIPLEDGLRSLIK